MRNLLLSAFLLASSFQIALGETFGDYTYTVLNGEVTITKNNNFTSTTIIFPASINGLPVKAIGGSIANWNTVINGNVTTVIIPEGVTRIGYYAFSNCNKLTSITIPNTITNIDVGAFTSCWGFTSITLPTGLKSIGDTVLNNCFNLVSIVIPTGVTSIGMNAFGGCSGLSSIDIPNSVTSIGSSAFSYCTNLTSIIIPSGLTSLSESLFSSCNKLTSITIPSGITTIGNNVFNSCTSLTNITIPSTVTTIGSGAFLGCKNLTTIIIPSSVTSIGASAFSFCESLNTITMPDRYLGEISYLGLTGKVATDYLISALANNDAFVTAVANKILAKSGNYGLSVKSELGTLATKSELTTALAESRTDGVNSVLSNPNLWTLYTTSQIQNMAVGDLVLTRQVNGGFVLNYDIEQSTDLQTWTRYQALSLPINGLPTDKAFVRIKAKQ